MKARSSKPRKQFTDQFRKKIVSELKKPGITVSKLSEAHNINSALIYKWKSKPKYAEECTETSFVPVKAKQPSAEKKITIRIGDVVVDLIGDHDHAMVAQIAKALGSPHAIV